MHVRFCYSQLLICSHVTLKYSNISIKVCKIDNRKLMQNNCTFIGEGRVATSYVINVVQRRKYRVIELAI